MQTGRNKRIAWVTMLMLGAVAIWGAVWHTANRTQNAVYPQKANAVVPLETAKDAEGTTRQDAAHAVTQALSANRAEGGSEANTWTTSEHGARTSIRNRNAIPPQEAVIRIGDWLAESGTEWRQTQTSARMTTAASHAARLARQVKRVPLAAAGDQFLISARAVDLTGNDGTVNGISSSTISAKTESRSNGNSDETQTIDQENQTSVGETSGITTEAVTGNGITSSDTGVTQAGETATVEPQPIVTPLDVVQIARQWQDDVLQVSFAVMLDDDQQTITPNGLIVCQQIPEGWEVVESEPKVQAVDNKNRIAKWLFVGQAVTNNSIYSLSMRAATGNTGVWNQTRAWYTYRQPDGQCVEVAVIPYSGSDIQPLP